MIQCKKCKLFMSVNKDDFVKCKGGNVNSKQFMQTTKCDDCQKKKRYFYTYTTISPINTKPIRSNRRESVV
ncbi:unnamed protein product [Euphydryas editha]|uniref:Uncharacterized protein n=1 Tax=Euphydryas editha TaxID=104508 RepID=A0AAU9V0N8_EUPED|nr:unnamed protein product [Euphydryas editha]